MADRISVDPDRMLAAARGMQTFKEMFAGNLSRNHLAATQYLDAFGGDEFGVKLYGEYEKMAMPLWENSSSLGEAVGRVGTNADYSAKAWHETNNLGGELPAPVEPKVNPGEPAPHPAPRP
jgi:hypothetical protein